MVYVAKKCSISAN